MITPSTFPASDGGKEGGTRTVMRGRYKAGEGWRWRGEGKGLEGRARTLAANDRPEKRKCPLAVKAL